jgi:hypothetical protein
VIWARELDPISTQALLDHFRDRRLWLVNVRGPTCSLQRLR